MRILLHAPVDLSLPGGVETHVRELAHGLVLRGHDVEICSRTRELPPFRLVRRIDPTRYDILHDHATVWPRRLPRDERYVRTAHFCTAEKMAVYVRMGRVQTLLNRGNWRAVQGERAAARSGTRWIAVSERLRGELARWYRIPSERITTISNGASFAPARTPRTLLRERWGIAPHGMVVLTIGRRDFVKGLDLFERAWRRARIHESATWVMVGGERERRSPGRIVTGPLDPGAISDWIHAADLGAFPSYYEGCGIVLLDMLAGGLFTLSHEVGIAPEVIEPGGNGAILPRKPTAWATALETSIIVPRRKSPGLSRERGWSAMVERVEMVYREMLEGAGGAAHAGNRASNAAGGA